MLESYQLWTRRLNTASLAVAGAGIALIVVTMAGDVLAREFMSQPLPGTLELVGQWWMPIVCFLALGAAQLGNEHIRVTFLVDNAGAETRKWAELLSNVAAAGALVWLGALAFRAASESIGIREKAAGERWLPLWPTKVVVAVGLLLFFLSVIATLLRHVTDFRSDDARKAG